MAEWGEAGELQDWPENFRSKDGNVLCQCKGTEEHVRGSCRATAMAYDAYVHFVAARRRSFALPICEDCLTAWEHGGDCCPYEKK